MIDWEFFAFKLKIQNRPEVFSLYRLYCFIQLKVRRVFDHNNKLKLERIRFHMTRVTTGRQNSDVFLVQVEQYTVTQIKTLTLLQHIHSIYLYT